MEKADPWKGIKGLLEELDDNRGLHLRRDREVTWPSEEILSAQDETLCP